MLHRKSCFIDKVHFINQKKVSSNRNKAVRAKCIV